MLYEMLTGAKPHEGESPIAVAYKHVHTDVPPPSAAVPGIPAYVDALVARATSRDRTQRPADAGVFLHQIHRVAQAVRDGVPDDPELTADLAPRPVREPVADDGPEATIPRARQTPGRPQRHGRRPVRPGGAGQLPRGRPTESFEALPGPGAPRARAADGRSPLPLPKRPATLLPVRQRRSRRGPIIFVLAVLLVVAGGVGAYWFGVARYTTTPGVIGLAQATAVDQARGRGSQRRPRARRRTPRPCRPARSSRPTPTRAPGSSTTAPSR